MASGFNIATFASRGLTGGGARPSFFEVYMFIPPAINADSQTSDKFRFTCQATSVPPVIQGDISLPYFGGNIKVAGDTTFPDWSVTVMNDEDFLVRSMFEKWQNAKKRFISQVRDPAIVTEKDYKTTMNIIHYGKKGDIIRTYNMTCHPKEVGPIQLAWESQNRIETFDVNFAVDWWLPGDETVNPYAGDAQIPIAS